MNAPIPFHALLIGGPAHGEAIWIKAGTAIELAGEGGAIHRYIVKTVALRNVFFNVGFCDSPSPSDKEMQSLEDFIVQRALEARPAPRQ